MLCLPFILCFCSHCYNWSPWIAEQHCWGGGVAGWSDGGGHFGAHSQPLAGLSGGCGGSLLCRGDTGAPCFQTRCLDPGKWVAQHRTEAAGVCVCVLNAALHVRSTTFCEYAFLSRQHDSIMTWTHLEREMVSYRWENSKDRTEICKERIKLVSVWHQTWATCWITLYLNSFPLIRLHMLHSLKITQHLHSFHQFNQWNTSLILNTMDSSF